MGGSDGWFKFRKHLKKTQKRIQTTIHPPSTKIARKVEGNGGKWREGRGASGGKEEGWKGKVRERGVCTHTQTCAHIHKNPLQPRTSFIPKK